MRILGIDPGYGIVGWGVVDKNSQGKCTAIDYGAINTPKEMGIAQRLAIIDDAITNLVEHFKPDVMAIEELFFNTNITTGIKVAQARGVIITAGFKAGLQIYEYTPLQVKQALTGYGRAEKSQIQYMTMMMLNLKKIPKPDDTADALALALTHSQTNNQIKSNLMN